MKDVNVLLAPMNLVLHFVQLVMQPVLFAQGLNNMIVNNVKKIEICHFVAVQKVFMIMVNKMIVKVNQNIFKKN